MPFTNDNISYAFGNNEQEAQTVMEHKDLISVLCLHY